MKYTRIHNHIRVRMVLIVCAVLLFTPAYTHAQYTYNGKTFATFDDMQRYIVAYMEAWREVYGDTSNNTPRPAPTTNKRNDLTIETAIARDVAHASVRFTGDVTYDTSERVRVWFDYGTAPAYLTMRTATQVLSENRDEHSFDAKAQGLLPNTIYYYRAGGIDEHGTVRYGTVRSIRTAIDTSASTARVDAKTQRAKDIDNNRATLSGTLRVKQEQYAYYWFEYGEDEDDLFMRTPRTLFQKNDDRNVTYTVRRLDESEKYFYRIVAMDVSGDLRYGKTVSFTTKKDIKDEAPVVKTLRPESVGTHTATLVGTIDMNDFRDGTIFFVYGEDRDAIRDVEKQYDSYEDIRERGDDRQKIFLDASLTKDKRYKKTLTALDARTRQYYAIGVAYENEDDDMVIMLGNVYSFTTKR